MTTDTEPPRVAVAIATRSRRGLGEAITRALRKLGGASEVVVVSAGTAFIGFDSVLALDAESLAHARTVGAPRLAYVSDAWWEDAERTLGASLVFRAYGPAQSDGGSPTSELSGVREVRCGPIAPSGIGPLPDKEAAKRERSFEEGVPIVLVTESAFAPEGAQAIILQLALVKPPVQLLLHVGRDVQLAERLRQLISAHGMEASLMSETAETAQLWGLADLTVSGADPNHNTRSLAVHVPVLTFADRASEVAGGAMVSLPNSTMLAVELDAALEPDALAARSARARELDPAGGAERLARAMLGWCAERAEERLPAGLPEGFERIGGADKSPEEAADDGGSQASALEDRVDEDLAALKARLKLD